MKIVTLLVAMWLCHISANAQMIIEKNISFSGKESVSMKIQIADSINIQTWNKNEVYAKASVNINENKDNNAYETSFDESGNAVMINAKFRDNYFKGKDNCCNEARIFWQFYLPVKTRFSVETINANVMITGQTRQMNIKSISGFIDLAVPANKKADIDLSTISGRIYSDLSISSTGEHNTLPVKIKQKLNDGGDPIRLETISGDIFFRKSD